VNVTLRLWWRVKSYIKINMVAGEGFEPSKAEPGPANQCLF
jgi:hypothetical protein